MKKHIKMTTKLGYIVRKFLLGESGIVEKVEDFKTEGVSEEGIKSWRDDFRLLPQTISFRNPLGQLITRASYVQEKVYIKKADKPYTELAFKYKRYKTGDQFP